MDLIVSLCRTLASDVRLRILEAVVQHPGTTVGSLCERIASPQPQVSKHLSLLAKASLLDLRPSGRTVHVHPPSEGTGSDALSRALYRLCAGVWEESRDGNSTHSHVWNCLATPELGVPEHGGQARERMAFCLTGYTHLRRLLILRLLAQEGPATPSALSERVPMSPPAVSRQLAKLQRRGLVQRAETQESPRWRLVAKPIMPFQAQLHRLIMRALAAEPLC